jgi:hypothetical protein
LKKAPKTKVGQIKREKIGINAVKLKLNSENIGEVNHKIVSEITEDINYKILNWEPGQTSAT